MSVDKEQYAHYLEEPMLRTTLRMRSTSVPEGVLDWPSGYQEELADL